MADDRPVLSLCLVDEAVAQASLLPTVLTLLEQRGFEVLHVEQVDATDGLPSLPPPTGLAPVRSPGHVLVLVDAVPLTAARATRDAGRLGNPRLRTVAALERSLRRAWGQRRAGNDARLPDTPLLQVVDAPSDGWEPFGRLLPGHVDRVRQRVLELEVAVRPPFRQVRRLDGWAISCRTDVVEVDGGLAVCRTFRPGREGALSGELAVYALADRLQEVVQPLATGANWVLLPYLEDHRELAHAFPGTLPAGLVRRCAMAYQSISDAGLGLLDFDVHNILVAPNGRLVLLDFEHVVRYADAPPSSLLDTPLGRGQAFFETAMPQDPVARLLFQPRVLKTWERHWTPRTGLSLPDVTRCGLLGLVVRRTLRLGRRRVIRARGRVRARSAAA